jgi:hypothetical protein
MLQGGETYMYRYGEAGRLESIILPTGETMSLASHLTEDDGLAVQVSAPVQSLSIAMPEQPAVTTLKMKGRGAHRLTIREGLYYLTSYKYCASGHYHPSDYFYLKHHLVPTYQKKRHTDEPEPK